MSILKVKENDTWTELPSLSPATTEVIDNLNSTNAVAALSANQGRELKQIIEDLNEDTISPIENELDTLSTNLNVVKSDLTNLQNFTYAYEIPVIINSSGTSAAEAINALGSIVGGIESSYMSVAVAELDAGIASYINTNVNLVSGGPNYQAFVAGTTTLYTAIITNYSAFYIILLKRIFNTYYATYIGPRPS